MGLFFKDFCRLLRFLGAVLRSRVKEDPRVRLEDLRLDDDRRRLEDLRLEGI